MTHIAIEELDSQIPSIKQDLDDYFGEELFSRMNSFLWAGRLNADSVVDKLFQSLLDHCLIAKDSYNMAGVEVYRLTDLGYLYCMRTPEIWDRERTLKIDEHSLLVLNPDDYDQNENIYSAVGSIDGELLLLDWTHEKFNAQGERIYHHKALRNELIHATTEEIQSNRRKDW